MFWSISMHSSSTSLFCSFSSVSVTNAVRELLRAKNVTESCEDPPQRGILPSKSRIAIFVRFHDRAHGMTGA